MRWLAAAMVLLFMVGCGGPITTDAGSDSAPGTDSAMVSDSGMPGSDSAPGTDSAPPGSDSAMGTDSGVDGG